MQRVRIGLTGLALVFLLVLLGAVIRSASDEDPANGNSVGQSQDSSAMVNGAELGEPLAELGVAPGSAEPSNGSAAAGVAPAKK